MRHQCLKSKFPFPCRRHVITRGKNFNGAFYAERPNGNRLEKRENFDGYPPRETCSAFPTSATHMRVLRNGMQIITYSLEKFYFHSATHSRAAAALVANPNSYPVSA